MPDVIASGNAQNTPSAKHVNTHSNFDMSYHNFDTFRFGEIHPHFVMECVPKDGVRLRCEHNLRSYSLKAPLMQKIQLKKDYFAVPMECILPFNWEKIYTNPVIGDDIPSDSGTYIADFTSLVQVNLNKIAPLMTSYSDGTDPNEVYSTLFNWLLTCELFASDGNLLSSLGIHLGKVFSAKIVLPHAKTTFTGTIDECIDQLCLDFIANGSSFRLSIDGNIGNLYPVTNFREALERMRDNLGHFSFIGMGGDIDAGIDDCEFNFKFGNNVYGLDIKRVLAYQLVCAHYYSNDHVDYIYSAELYRELINSYITYVLDNNGDDSRSDRSFLYNGVSTYYDFLSAFYFTYMIQHLDTNMLEVMPYLQAIFSYKHSLRYMDYFVGARTRPLAVGDVNVDVQTGSPNYVSVVDVTRRIQMQKYLNAVNKSGRKFSNYIKELFGNNVAPDYHNPFYLGHTADDIYGQEIENTNVVDQESSQQGLSIISNLRSNASKFEFSFDADRPCIVLGVSYFDIARSYYRSIERQNFHKDRFDMFNPYMQFIGDQEIYGHELFADEKYNGISQFGYTNRYQEYHQRYNQAQGGFIDHLPGYAFLNDLSSIELGNTELFIGPDFIRSKSFELDRFYISLTGFSLASYFHFIVDNYNDCRASRPMAFNPSIL